MPGPEFFRKLGLFLVDDFLQPGLCAQLCTEMCCAPSKAAGIVSASGGVLIDESVRRVLRAKVRGPNERFVRERLEEIRPKLEEHFNVFLAPDPSPEFLAYKQGGFYTPHTDTSHPDIRQRRVSVVIFLNRELDQPVQGCYGGGKLTFHGVLSEPQWDKCAFGLVSQPGLLVAFRPDLLHEVKPVRFGQRFTIVCWFLASAKETAPGTMVRSQNPHGRLVHDPILDSD